MIILNAKREHLSCANYLVPHIMIINVIKHASLEKF